MCVAFVFHVLLLLRFLSRFCASEMRSPLFSQSRKDIQSDTRKVSMVISSFLAGRIFEKCSSGVSRRAAAEALKVSPTTVNKVMRRPETFETPVKASRARRGIADRRKAVRKRALQNRYSLSTEGGEGVAIARLYPTAGAIAKSLARQFPGITAATVCRDLKAEGIALRVRPKVVANSAALNAKRLAFAKRMLRARNFRKIVFSDEAWVNDNDNTHRREWVDLANPNETRPTPRVHQKRPKTKVMVWGAIGLNFKSPLIILTQSVTAETYISDILEVAKGSLPSDCIFMQDNARPHVANITRRWFADNGVRLLDGWPAHSPHLNPIEHLWALLHKAIAKRRPKTIAELERIAVQVWDAIPMETINNLVKGFSGDLKKCVERDGEPW